MKFLCFVIGSVLCVRAFADTEDFSNPDVVILGCGAVLIVFSMFAKKTKVSSSARKKTMAQRVSAGEFTSDGDINEQVLAVLGEGSKIEAIKCYRALAGCGLKEAKEYVDHLESQRRTR